MRLLFSALVVVGIVVGGNIENLKWFGRLYIRSRYFIAGEKAMENNMFQIF